jgi:hypothetical protein
LSLQTFELYENAFPVRNQDLRNIRASGNGTREFSYDRSMNDTSDHRPGSAPPQIRSEAHGPHWVAWVADSNGKPENSIILVGETREEAEQRAKEWAGQNARK